MLRLLLVTLTVLTVFAVVQGKKWKSCERRIRRFERCLERGYKSKAGCVSGEGKLEGSRAWRRCRKLEKKIAKKCDYVCEKEPVLIPEECRLKFVGLIGTELRSLQPSTFEDCRVACSDDSDCEGFTFKDMSSFHDRKDHLKCILMAEITKMNHKSGYTSMIKGCDRSELDMSCVEEKTRYTHDDRDTRWSYSVGYPSVDNIEECARACQIFKTCKSLTYTYDDFEDDILCSLYRTAPGEDESGFKKVDSESYSSMTMNCDAI